MNRHEAKLGVTDPKPKVVAWEVTRRCALQCQHCRGAARNEHYDGELTTAECHRVLHSLSAFCKPVLILTGGEPMSREDIFELARSASDLGIHPVLAPCGHLITPVTARRMVEAGIQAISISIDGATAESHDAFRGVPGAYERTKTGLAHARAAGMPFQINTTVTRHNLHELPGILETAIAWGARTWDLFFLVPTGRGSAIRNLEISPAEHEALLHWVYHVSQRAPLRVKTTCAPHYARVQRQLRKESRSPGLGASALPPFPGAAGNTCPAAGDPHYVSGGCMGGDGFVFISHRGILQTCGFMDLPCGDLREVEYDFKRAYLGSHVFGAVRNRGLYGGKCGVCEYLKICGGCRARAYAHDGDFLGAEPNCVYMPRQARLTSERSVGDELARPDPVEC